MQRNLQTPLRHCRMQRKTRSKQERKEDAMEHTVRSNLPDEMLTKATDQAIKHDNQTDRTDRLTDTQIDTTNSTEAMYVSDLFSGGQSWRPSVENWNDIRTCRQPKIQMVKYFGVFRSLI